MTIVYSWTARDVVTVTGPDAVGYLQGQISQDVAAMAPGEARWSFVLAPQGKVDGWGRLLRVDGDTFQVDTDPGAGAAWETRLRRFLMRTKVEIEVREAVPTLAIRGAALTGALPCGWPGTVGSDLLGVGLVVGDEDPAAALPADLPDDALEISAEALDALRIRAGVPRWGAELDGDTIPATVGQWAIDASVSFTKGCFTGQELVARIDSRGGNVPRRLAVVLIDGPAPAPGAEVTVGDKAVGTITSSAPDPVAAAGSGPANGQAATSVAMAYIARSVEIPADAQVAGAPGHLVAPPI